MTTTITISRTGTQGPPGALNQADIDLFNSRTASAEAAKVAAEAASVQAGVHADAAAGSEQVAGVQAAAAVAAGAQAAAAQGAAELARDTAASWAAQAQTTVQDVRSDITALENGQAAGQIVVETWATLSGMTGAPGVGAQIINDTGTHTDPVVGGTVANAGQYVWSTSPAGWKWVREDGLALKADKTELDTLSNIAVRAVSGKNLFNKATVTVGYYIDPNGGALVAGATYDTSDFIPVLPNTTYYGRGANSNMRFRAYYTSNGVLIPDSNTDETNSFTTPANCYFVRISIWHTDIDTFQFEQGTAQTSYEPFNYIARSADGSSIIAEPADASVTTAKLSKASVSPEKTSFLILSKNLFNKEIVTVGYYIDPSGGALVEGATYDTSDFIPVLPNTTYYGRGANSNMRFRAYYTSNRVLIPDSNNGATNSFTTPAYCYFVRISIWHTDLDTFQFEQGTAQTSYEPFGYVFTSDINMNARASSWAGLAWASFGDSITASENWQGNVVASTGLVHTNYGLGGTKISGAVGDTNAMCQDTRINAIPTTTDLITLMGGTNDWAQNVALGAEDSTDPTTFNGALNTFAAKAFTRWPSKKLALATTPYGEIVDWASRGGWTSAAHNSLGLTTNAYAEEIRKASSRLNIPLIDVAKFGGWGSINIETYLGGSTTDHLHPAAGSFAARGISSVFISALRQFEPIT